MISQMVVADSSVSYAPKEAALLLIALAWVIAVASVALASIVICGWHASKDLDLDFKNLKTTFKCK